MGGWVLCSSIGRECVVWVGLWVVVLGGLDAMSWYIYFFFPMGGSLGWVMFDLYIIEFKYVGCDCVGSYLREVPVC